MMTTEQSVAVNAEIDELVSLAKESIEEHPGSRLPLTILLGCTKDPITGAELLDVQKGRGGIAWIPVVLEHDDAAAKQLLYDARSVAIAGEAIVAVHFVMTTAVVYETTKADVGKSGNQVATERGIKSADDVIKNPDAKLVIVACIEQKGDTGLATRMWNLTIDQGIADLDEVNTISETIPVIAGGSMPSILIDDTPPDNIKAQARRVAYSYLLRANEWSEEMTARENRARTTTGGDA